MMIKKTSNKQQKKAFALIEAVIIIVIIAILIITIISIKQLNKNNSIKAIIAQIANFDRAVSQFYHQYNALPGDVASTVVFGLSDHNSDGNNNGIIEDDNDDIISASGEITNFWWHLSKAKMLRQNFDGKQNSAAKIGTTFPISKIGNRIAISVFGYDGKNYYQIGVISANDHTIVTTNNSLKVAESFSIDVKIDDGLPKKGRITVVGGNKVNQINAHTKCTANQEYNFQTNMPACQLRIEMGGI